jgi:hypothetical protein
MEDGAMAYSVMVWLVQPGEGPYEGEEEELAALKREQAPGARTGVNMGAAIPRIVYGVYDDQSEADGALAEISDNLRQNVPLRIPQHGNRVFLVPADRVHYVVSDEVTRPKDER